MSLNTAARNCRLMRWCGVKVRVHPASSTREKNRNKRFQQQAPGCTSKEELAPSGLSIGPHDKQIDPMGKHVCLKDLADQSALGVDLIQNDIDTVMGKISCQFFGGMLGIKRFFVRDDNDADLLRLLKKGKRVRNRTRRGATEIPSHADGIELKRA
jgi:hypothetical protein